MMGTYPLLHAQYTTAKREKQVVFGKNANKPACIKMAVLIPFRKFENTAAKACHRWERRQRRRRHNKQKGVMD